MQTKKDRIKFFVTLQTVRIGETGHPSKLYADKIRELKENMEDELKENSFQEPAE